MKLFVGDIVIFWECLLSVYFLFSVFGYVFGFGYVLYFVDICFVWYVSGFEVSMNLYACIDIFISNMIFILVIFTKVVYVVYVLCF